MPLQRTNYDGLPPPAGPYVHGVRHGNTLYLSGFTAYGTPAQSQGMKEQVVSIFDQISTAAEQEGTSLENLIKVTLFVPDMSLIQELRSALEKVYKDNKPASSLLEVNALFEPDLKLEVETIFAIP